MTRADEVRMIIVNAMRDEGINCHELGEWSGVEPRTINYWKQGRSNPTIGTADKVLKTLKMSVTLGVEEEE